MKIFLITDIHYGKDINYPRLVGEDYVNLFGSKISGLSAKLIPEMEKCDLVINLGDFICNENQEKDIETYKNALLFTSSKIPTKYVPGNHDLLNITREKWSELIGENNSYYSFDAGGYHHIVLDGTRTEPRGPHYVGDEQLKWLEDDLAKTSLNSIVYCHYPLDNQNMENNYYFKDKPENGSLSNRYFVRRILERSGKVLVVFGGHTHFYNQQIMKGIMYCTVPSFSENNGANEPKLEYVIATLTDNHITTEVKKIDSL